MCAFGRFITVDKETMYYRENQNSESHVIQSRESQLGVSLALTRFFTGAEYQKILASVSEDKKEYFLNAMVEALEFRLKGNPLAGFVLLICLEGLIPAWGYTSREVIKLGFGCYSLIESELSSSLFARLGKSCHGMSKKELDSLKLSAISQLMGLFPAANPHSNTKAALVINENAIKVFQALPYKIKKNIIKYTIKTTQKLGKSKNFRLR
jgi:hypothetical protein